MNNTDKTTVSNTNLISELTPQLKRRQGKGFTLAEILITLTVIGVVAALTIPTLLQNTNQAELKAAWKRNFAELNQATMQIANESGGTLANVFTGADANVMSNSMINAYAAHLSYIKKCDSAISNTPEGSQCWHENDKWYWLSGKKDDENVGAGLVLSNGSLFVETLLFPACTWGVSPKGDACGYGTVDVNGFKSPNMIGKDIFSFYITNPGVIVPMGAQGSHTDDNYDICNLSINPDSKGWACSADYLYQ